MRTVESLSSLSTLVVGSTMLSSYSPASAFVPPVLTPSHQSHSCLLTLSAAPADLPPPTDASTTTMTSLTASNTAAAAFLAQASNKAPLLADPSIVLGQQPAFVAKTPELVATEGEEVAAVAQLVPPSKSLRTRLNLPSSQDTTITTRKQPRIVGHRGSLYEELENTRPSFLACEGTCDAVELDVFVLKDGTLVVYHGSGGDATPGLLHKYCTNTAKEGATSILDLTYQETQQLAFNPAYAELAAPSYRVLQGRIPTLDEVLTDMKPTGMEVKIELKGPGTAQPVVELVDRLNMVDQVSFSSFNHDEIATVRRLRPQRNEDGTFVYRTGALFDQVPDDFVERAQRVQASEVHLRYDMCTTDRIEAIHRAGMGSMAWMRGPIGMKSDVSNKFWDIGNEDATCYETIVETGVQQLCVNKPKVLYEYLQSKQAMEATLFAAQSA